MPFKAAATEHHRSRDCIASGRNHRLHHVARMVDVHRIERSIYYDNQTKGAVELVRGNDYGLSNVAATVVNLLGFEAPDIWDASTVRLK